MRTAVKASTISAWVLATLVFAPANAQAGPLIDWLFGRCTGSATRAVISRSLADSGLTPDQRRAIARVCGQGPYKLALLDGLALADGLNSDVRGHRALCYRATLRGFPSVHQVVDYFPDESGELRGRAAEAFERELNAIAEHHGFRTGSSHFRYSWPR